MFFNAIVHMLLIVVLWFSTGLSQIFPQGNRLSQTRERSISNAEILAAPAAFSKLSPVNNVAGIALTGAVLSWSPSSSGVTYQYCLRPGTSPKCPAANKWVSVGASTTATIPTLAVNTLYSWQVRAVSTADGSITYASGGWWFFRTTSTSALPGAFTKLAPANPSTNLPVNGLALSWAASAYATSYEYCYDTVDDNACATGWVSTTATSATLNNLAYSRQYFWQVRAINVNGSANANQGLWYRFTTTFAAPQAFSKKSPANGTAEQPLTFTLEWDPSIGEEVVYEYCYDTTSGSTCQNSLAWTSTGTNTSVVISGLSYDTTYSWQARARNATGVTPANNGGYWNFTTAIAPPGNFQKSTPANGAGEVSLSPTLTWGTSVGKNVTYEYCLTDTPVAVTCDKTWLPAGTSLQAALSGLQFNTLYSWQVRAVNASGTTYADSGSLHSFRTDIAPPTPFSKLAPTQGIIDQPVDITLSWSPSENAAAYFYCIDKTDNGVCDSGWVLNDHRTSAAPSTLDYGNTTYYWQVYAHNDEGDSFANGGTWWSFTTRQELPADFTKLSPQPDAVDVQTTPWLYWWSGGADTSSYQYCINTTPSCPSELDWVEGNLNTSVQVPAARNLLPGTMYYWQVRAVNATGNTQSNTNVWWSFTTIMPGPTSSNQAFPGCLEDQPCSGALTASSNYATIFSLVGSPPPGSLDLDSDGSFIYTPPQNFTGTASFNFIVSDGYNPPSPSYTTTIQIIGVPDAPVLSVIPDLVVSTREQISFTITASDDDLPGDTLVLSILEQLPPGATFNPMTGLFHWLPEWSPLHPQPYTFTARVIDSTGLLADTQEFQVTVLPLLSRVPMVRR
jgi:hypothetical protein